MSEQTPRDLDVLREGYLDLHSVWSAKLALVGGYTVHMFLNVSHNQ